MTTDTPIPRITLPQISEEIHTLASKLGLAIIDSMMQEKFQTQSVITNSVIAHEALAIVCATLIGSLTKIIADEGGDGKLPYQLSPADEHFAQLAFMNFTLAIASGTKCSFARIVQQTTRQYAVEQRQLSELGEKLEATLLKYKPKDLR